MKSSIIITPCGFLHTEPCTKHIMLQPCNDVSTERRAVRFASGLNEHCLYCAQRANFGQLHFVALWKQEKQSLPKSPFLHTTVNNPTVLMESGSIVPPDSKKTWHKLPPGLNIREVSCFREFMETVGHRHKDHKCYLDDSPI